MRSRVLLAALALLVAPLAVLSPAHASGWTPRPPQFAGTTTQHDLAIPMSDGTVLRGDLTVPADAAGTAVPGRWPVVVTITAYNKSTADIPGAGALAGPAAAYLVTRGYAQLTVDARGTGSSAGTWCAFCTREDQDAGEVLTWAARQPWSNGATAMAGPSYMGIDQIFAAADQPTGLKAIFPQVPAADVYRDVVSAGGEIDASFMPLWLGLVTVTGLVPPAVTASDPTSGLTALADHLNALATFTLPMLAEAVGGQDPAYDGDFYAQRSPINVVSRVSVPTFLVSGEYDLFQRGTPLLFENLQQRGVPVKMLVGPWSHLDGSSGAKVGDAGLGSLPELQLRWFDHYVKGMPDPALDADVPPIRYYEQGTNVWRDAQRWVDTSDTRATSLPLAGSATPGTPASLGVPATTAGTSTVLPNPIAGLCSRSTDQWTAGAGEMFQLFNTPCFQSDRFNTAPATLFRTTPLQRDLPIFGPIDAHLYVSSTSGNGLLSVALDDVAPDGTVTPLTGGWQLISQRANDTSRSRYLDGRMIQPYHPFTRATDQPAQAGQVVPVDVEVFPTGASIQRGHRLQLSVQAFDTPHALPTLTDGLGSLSVISVHASPAYPSAIVLPTRDRDVATPLLAGAVTVHRHGRQVRIDVANGHGTVRVRIDRGRWRTLSLVHGRASFRLPRLAPGRHTLTVRYGATVARVRWRVR